MRGFSMGVGAMLISLVALLAHCTFCAADSIAPGAVYSGMCDASAAIALGGPYFAVADDEENIIYTYSLESPGTPIARTPLDSIESITERAALKKAKKPKREKLSQPSQTDELSHEQLLDLARKLPESDIEAAARFGNTILWVGSHGQNARGKQAPHRRRIHLTSVSATKRPPSISPLGKPFSGFLTELLSHKAFAHLKLNEAAELAPKFPGGIAIEGFVVDPSGIAYIGFRNPTVRGKALVIALSNPGAIIRHEQLRFGEAIFLDLGGRGIKDLVMADSSILIAAGDPLSPKRSALYRWESPPSPESVSLITSLEASELNVEALLLLDDRGKLLLLSDDGNEIIGDETCKRLKNRAQRRFRTAELSIGK